MRHVRLAIALGAFSALAAIGACSLDESGSFDSGGPDVFVTNDSGVLDVINVEDVTYDVPDLGVGETESGLPCTCVSSIPAGYWVVEYSPNAQDNCSTGYANHSDWQETTGAPAQCGCSCKGVSQDPTCTCGFNALFDIASGNNNNCNNGPSGETLKGDQAPTCYNAQQNLNTGSGDKLNYMKASQSTPNECGVEGGTCNAPAVTNTVAPPTTVHGRSCPLDAGLGTCNTGVCVPTQDAPYSLCVTNGQATPGCPSGDFPIAHFVGTGYTDTRGCGPDTCSCNLLDAGTCSTPVLNLYTNNNDSNCTTATANLPIDNATCVQTNYGGMETFYSASYTIAYEGGAACGFNGTYVADGGITMTGGYTICCHP